MEYFLTFVEGIITFISPCILPMLPIYLIYFAGGREQSVKRLLLNVLAFIAGFTLIFVSLGALAGSLGYFLRRHQTWVQIITGAVVIFFGLRYLGLFGGAGLDKGMKADDRMKDLNPGRSFLFGLVFSLAWTPCLGTFLGSALMLAGQAGTAGKGMALLLLYSLGLGIPFLLSALLLNRLQNFFNWIKQHFAVIQKICGVALVVLGLLMATGTLYRASLKNAPDPESSILSGLEESQSDESADDASSGSTDDASSESAGNTSSGSTDGAPFESADGTSSGSADGKSSNSAESPNAPTGSSAGHDPASESASSQDPTYEALSRMGPNIEVEDFSFENAEGKRVKLSDYSDKPIILNFWASWCPPCRAEMASFQKAYDHYGDQIHFIMLNATDGERETKESAMEFIKEQRYSFPVAFDSGQEGMVAFNIYAFPTTAFLWKGKKVHTNIGMIRDKDLARAIDHLLKEAGIEAD